jgi:hypothetical protein
MVTLSFFNNKDGMDLQENTLATSKKQAEWIENLHLNPSGQWSTENVGTRRLTLTPSLNPTGAILSLHAFSEVNGATKLLAQTPQGLHAIQIANGTTTPLVTTYTTTHRARSTSFLGWLFLVAEGQTPLRWNGTDTPQALPNWPATIAGINVGQPSLLTTFTNRLIFSGDPNNPSVLYISALENPENFSPSTGPAGAGAIQVSPGDGDKIVGLSRIFLPVSNQEVLIIFKQYSIFMLTGNDGEAYALQRVSSETGAVNQESIINLNGSLLFLTPHKKIVSLNTNVLLGNLTMSNLEAPISPILEAVPTQQLKHAFATHLNERGEIWWWLPTGSQSFCTTVLVLNTLHNSAGIWSLRSGLSAQCAVVKDGLYFTGNHQGEMVQQLIGSHYDGQAIAWKYRTPFLTLNTPHLRKRIQSVVLYLKQASQRGLRLLTRWDLQPRPSDSITIAYPHIYLDLNLLFGTARFGQSRFGVQSPSTAKGFPAGSGKLLQLEWFGTLPEQPIELEGWLIETHEGGTR